MNGFLLVDKANNCTSHDVVAKIRRLTKCKVGHLGTLDPFATGLLPIAIGKATKFADYFLQQNKFYRFTIKWGANTDSLDSTGKITKLSDKVPELSQIEKKLEDYKGENKQIPPQFSALKIKGKAAYKYAREGKHVDLAARRINIYELNLLKFSYKEASFAVYCSKGTYVRALARDICADLGVCGHVSMLRREYVEIFKNFDVAMNSEFIFKEAKLDDIAQNIIKIDQVIKLKYNYVINQNHYNNLFNGVKLSINNLPFKEEEDIKLKIGANFCMIANYKCGYLKTKKLLTN